MVFKVGLGLARVSLGFIFSLLRVCAGFIYRLFRVY